MKKIIYKIGGINLDLNGEILQNVRSKIDKPNAYILQELGYYKFMYNNTNYSFCTKSKEAMHAYLCGILNF